MLGLAIWREARGESYRGQLAVGQVIENRVNDSRWPDTYPSVIAQPWQFSAFNANDPNAKLWPDPDRSQADADTWVSCYEAATEVISRNCTDFAGGANHYHSRHITAPSWATKDKVVLTVGDHIFYKL